MSVIQLLHGTDHIIEVPDIHIGNPHNDYGMGFYCTRVDEMAREWACKKNTDGFVNSYDFDTEGLKVLNLLDGTHTVLNWMALLLQFRTFKLDSEVAVDARDYLIGHYTGDFAHMGFFSLFFFPDLPLSFLFLSAAAFILLLLFRNTLGRAEFADNLLDFIRGIVPLNIPCKSKNIPKT